MSDSKPEVAVPQRTLNLSQGVLYGIGCGIGASIFILLGPGISLANVGVLMSLALGALLIFFTALNYAELSTSLPIAGGSYNFSKEGLGGFLAFIIGFFLWIANIAACSFSARTFALVFENLFKRFGIEIEAPIGVIVAIISILFTSLVIFRTQHIAIKTLINLTLIILGIFLFFILSGLILAPFNSNYDPGFLDEPYSLFGVIAAVPLLLLPFTTILSNLAYLNSDFKNPSKNIPKAYIIAITIALAIYLLVSIVVLININGDPNNLSENPLLLANILGSVLGPLGIFGFFLMIFAAFISTLVAINAALGSAVSVVTALTRDRYFPQKVKEIKKRSQMPVLALSITALFAIIFTYFAEIGLAAETTTFIYFFGLAFVNYAAVKLRRKRKELDRPFKAPFFPYLPYIISGFFVVLALFFFSPEAVFLGLVLLSIGVAYYLLTISDRPSKMLTIAGMKATLIISIIIIILLLNNFSVLSLELLLITRILIIIAIITIGTIILDVKPLREIIYFFIKRVDKEKVAINIGGGQIINLGKKPLKTIHFINNVIALFQFISFIIVSSIAALLINNVIPISQIDTGLTIIPSLTTYFIFNSALIFFGVVLLFSSIFLWFMNRELKSIGI